MFEVLSDKLQGVFKSLRGHGTLSAAQVEGSLREIRIALLEADVHFRVVKDFLERVRVRATGQDVLKSLTPAQAVVRVVRDEMIALLGTESPRLEAASRPPSVILLTGLQGSGKTTTTAKLGRFLMKGAHHPLLVSTDIQRPAAREQLRTLGLQAGLKVHHPEPAEHPRGLMQSALGEARALGHDFVLVDTAGRLHIDDELMAELVELKLLAEPSDVLFVADAMTGQDAVRSAEEFHRRVGITGIVLTKLDGDARGGAALSATAVTGRPIKLLGVGEKLDDLEAFQPERLVSRILGMGDVLSLIERVEQTVDREQAEEMAARLRRSEFTLDDYRDQLRQFRRMGSLDQVLSMLPGMGSLKGMDTEQGEREMVRAAAIIDSMTPLERRDPTVINGNRRRRIARGSGTRVEDVNRLLKQYVQARKLMKTIGGGGKTMKRLMTRLPQFR